MPRSLLRKAGLLTCRLLAAGLLWLGLMSGWVVWGDAYGAFFRSGANLLFRGASQQVRVHFEPLPDAAAPASDQRMLDTDMIMINRRTARRGTLPISSQYLGYVPSTFLLALVLLTPVPWDRRLRALLCGLVLQHLFIGGQLALIALNTFATAPGGLALFAPGPLLRNVLTFATEVLTKALTPSFVVPMVVWVVVTFRRGDAALIMGPAASADQ